MYCVFDEDRQRFLNYPNYTRSNIVTCKICGESFPENEIEYYSLIFNMPICQECFNREMTEDEEDIHVCDCCGKVVEKNNFVHTYYNDYYCLDCYQFCE